MSKSDEMFEELGYEKIKDDVNWLIYSFDDKFKIMFYKPQQDFKIECQEDIYNTIDMQELQAIYQFCKERGWLDEV